MAFRLVSPHGTVRPLVPLRPGPSLTSLTELLSPKSQVPSKHHLSSQAQTPDDARAKIAATQKEIDGVISKMSENIESITERGERIDSLNNKAGQSERPPPLLLRLRS